MGAAERAGAATGTTPAGRAEIVRLAQEFEAVLLNEMLAGWRQALAADEEESGANLGPLADMVGTEFGRAISRTRGFGIADVLIRELQRQYGDAPSTSTGQETGVHSAVSSLQAAGVAPAAMVSMRVGSPSVAAPGSVPPGIAGTVDAVAGTRARIPVDGQAPKKPLVETDQPDRLDRSGGTDTVGQAVVRPAATVTSGFGWRTDPFNGRTKFHAGADVRMAYGQEVLSLAPGRITFAGEADGYGLTVMVDHGGGRATRYAHLSSTTVRVGDVVGRGAVIARSGNSGRSTGPHLHVELLQHGRPVDPSRLLARTDGG